MQKKFTHIQTSRPLEETSFKDCSDCPGICCHDLSITILKPVTKKEIDDLMWHLNYDTVGVYIRNRRWHLIVKGRCQYLDERNLCKIYDRRFDRCRNHQPPRCERFDNWYDVLFTTPFELEEYFKKERERRKKKRQKSRDGIKK